MKNNKQSLTAYQRKLKNYLLKLSSVQIPAKDKNFQKKVRALRRKWQIPIKGFGNKKQCIKLPHLPSSWGGRI